SKCEITHREPRITHHVQFGNPCHLLDSLMARFELLEEIDLPFPLGGCFGFWGYDLKNFSEPKLPRRAINDLELPDCHVGFYDSLVIFDHHAGKTFVVSTGLAADGSRDEKRAGEQLKFWENHLSSESQTPDRGSQTPTLAPIASNLSRDQFIAAVKRAQEYIRTGDVYQVNLSQRLSVESRFSAWQFFERLNALSPAPFSAYFDCDSGETVERFQLVSSSPEQFLRMSGSQIVTRPIKGTRPRDI